MPTIDMDPAVSCPFSQWAGKIPDDTDWAFSNFPGQPGEQLYHVSY